MTVTTNAPAQGGAEPPAVPEGYVSLTVDGIPTIAPKGDADHPGRRAARRRRSRGSATTRCSTRSAPAGSAWSRSRAQRKPMASCTTTVTEGMVVKTQLTSPVADKAQQGVMELLLINHPLDCPVCDKGGECPLQNQAHVQRPRRDPVRGHQAHLPQADQPLHPGAAGPRALRAVRALHPVLRADRRRPVHRADRARRQQQVGISRPGTSRSSSYFSGNTVQICPVGALTGAAYRFRARPFDLVSTPSVCEHCASGCAHAHRPPPRQGDCAGWPADDPQVNEEWNCDKGRWAFQYTTGGRPAHPPAGPRRGRRAGRRLRWPEALRRRGRRARARRAARRGVLAGGRLHRSRTPTRTPSSPGSRWAPTTSTSGPGRTRPRRPTFLGRARRRARCRRGSRRPTPTWRRPRPCCWSASSPRRSRRSSSCGCARRIRKRGLQVVAVAPVRHPRAAQARRHACSPAAPAPRPRSWPRWPPAGDGRPAERAADCCAAGAVILVGERLAASPGALSAVAALAEATGARLAWVPRRAGERGAVEAGALPNLLPGGRPVADAAARAEVAAAWGVEPLPDARRPGRRRRSSPRPPPASSRRCWSAASTRTTCPTRRPRWPRWTRSASWSAWSCAAAR